VALNVFMMTILLALLAPQAAAQYQQPWNGEAVPALPPQPLMARAVVSVALTVSDADRSIRFYTEVLNFRVIADRVASRSETEALTGISGTRTRQVALQLGDEQIELLQFLDRPGRPAPREMRSNDRWFQHVAIIVRNMDSAYAVLEQAGVEHVSSAPQTLPATIPAAAGISAFYFRDPDGHPLEILAFPPDKGLAKWHGTHGSQFLGIDHTAIVVASTAQSLRFYQALLGIPARGESLNFGLEQERLNNVAGARLHITGLRADRGPGVEFLDYRQPRSGRPYPADARPNDLLHWHTRILVDDVALALESARRAGAALVSPVAVTIDPATGYRRAALVRDPDGHAVEFVQR
jgi:catechol 2,3-dioxygenase-like lactoylglutathione lyase family enzyme